VVHEVLADALQLVHDVDGVPLEQVGRTDARDLEQLRRLEGARAQDDLAVGPGAMELPAPLVDDAGRRPALELDLRAERLGEDMQVRTAATRGDVPQRRGRPAAVPRGEVPVPDTRSVRAAEVVVARQAERLRSRVEERVRERVLPPRRLDAQRAVGSVVLRRP
jgi:hypothetical protein